MGKYQTSFNRIEKVIQERRRDIRRKNYPKRSNGIEANVSGQKVTQGQVFWKSRSNWLSPQTHQLLAVFLFSLESNNTGAKEIWNVLLVTLKSRLHTEAFGREKGIGEVNHWLQKYFESILDHGFSRQNIWALARDEMQPMRKRKLCLTEEFLTCLKGIEPEIWMRVRKEHSWRSKNFVINW